MTAPLAIISRVVGSRTEAQSVLDALAADGWVVVPRIPTEHMLDAAWASALAENAKGVWEEMIAASSPSG